MIYTTGTIAISGNTLTGTGTNFTAAGSLIRNGCTVIALTSPAQVFQITAIGSATSLTVTPAANPAVPSGTKYAILLSDSLSVDGLAQDIAETFTMYQRYMSGFADVMNGTSDVTITINGTAVTVPGQKSLAKKGANSDITSLSGLKTALSIEQGGTGANNAADALANLGLQTIKPDPISTKIFSPDLKKFLLVSNTSWGMWNNDSGAAIALPVSQGGTGQTTVDGVKTAFGIDKLQPKGNYVITDASTKQSLSDALSCRYGLEVTDSNNIVRVGIYSANNQPIITGINGKAIIIPDKAGTMALAGESVSALRLSAPREVTVTTADAWMNFTTSEMVVGIYIAPTPGGGAWVLNKVKVATLQAYINGAWFNVTQ